MILISPGPKLELVLMAKYKRNPERNSSDLVILQQNCYT
jgi:hypothetical protein